MPAGFVPVSALTKVDCWGKGLRVCFEYLRILNFAPDLPIVKIPRPSLP
jgi:hypothetical protein